MGNIEKYGINTRLISVYDYKNIDLSEFVLPFEVNNEQLERDIMSYRRKNAISKPADTAKAEDIVTFSSISDIPKFNKPEITVRLGRGLYDKAVEAAIVGMNVGQTKELAIGDSTAEITVKSITRTTLPQFDDENVAGWGIDGISTAKQLTDYLIQQQHAADTKETAETVAGEMMDIIAKKSAFDMDIEEFNDAKAKGEEMAQEMIAMNIKSENPTDEQCMEVFGGTKEQYTTYVIGVFINSFKSSVIGLKMLTESGVYPDENGYDEEIEKRSVETGFTRNELLEKMSFKDYVLQCGSDYLNNILEQYVTQYINIKENEK